MTSPQQGPYKRPATAPAHCGTTLQVSPGQRWLHVEYTARRRPIHTHTHVSIYATKTKHALAKHPLALTSQADRSHSMPIHLFTYCCSRQSRLTQVRKQIKVMYTSPRHAMLTPSQHPAWLCTHKDYDDRSSRTQLGAPPSRAVSQHPLPQGTSSFTRCCWQRRRRRLRRRWRRRQQLLRPAA